MKICTIYSEVVPQFNSGLLEPGRYELVVEVSMAQAAASGDALGFIKNEIAVHLAGCVHNTGLPLGEGFWNVMFSPFARNNFNFPEGYTV